MRGRLFRLLAPLVILACSSDEIVGPGSGPGVTRGLSAAADNGRIAFHSGRDGNFEIYLMNPDGTGQIRLTYSAGYDLLPAWSPDRTRIAFTSDRYSNPGSPPQIYVMNADGTAPTILTNSGANDAPAWSPDGTKIAFYSCCRDGNSEIYVMNADGTGQINRTNHPADDFYAAWSPDGTKIAFERVDDSGTIKVYVMNADGSGQTLLTETRASGSRPAWSPDGSKIAFTAIDSLSNHNIWVMNADGSDLRFVTRGAWPAWSPDRRKIAFNANFDGNVEVFSINVQGTGVVNLSDHAGGNAAPSWAAAELRPPQCFDGLDNDGDGKIDFPTDPGCSGARDNSESPDPTRTSQCSDGIDNDGDGKIDFPADPDCKRLGDNNEKR